MRLDKSVRAHPVQVLGTVTMQRMFVGADEAEIRGLMRPLSGHAGYHVDGVGSPAAALGYLRAWRTDEDTVVPPLVLISIRTPTDPRVSRRGESVLHLPLSLDYLVTAARQECDASMQPRGSSADRSRHSASSVT
jgi:hypothetical protein